MKQVVSPKEQISNIIKIVKVRRQSNVRVSFHLRTIAAHRCVTCCRRDRYIVYTIVYRPKRKPRFATPVGDVGKIIELSSGGCWDDHYSRVLDEFSYLLEMRMLILMGRVVGSVTG